MFPDFSFPKAVCSLPLLTEPVFHVIEAGVRDLDYLNPPWGSGWRERLGVLRVAEECKQDQVSNLSASGLCGTQELFTPTGAAVGDAGKFRNRKRVAGLGFSVPNQNLRMRRWRTRCEFSPEHVWVMTE